MDVYKQNLITLRDFVVNNKELVEQHLDMEVYYDELTKPGDVSGTAPGCGTSCCLIGWCAHIPGLREQIADLGDFDEIPEALFGMSPMSYEAHYLFGHRNDSYVDSAIKRLSNVIDHGSVIEVVKLAVLRCTDINEVVTAINTSSDYLYNHVAGCYAHIAVRDSDAGDAQIEAQFDKLYAAGAAFDSSVAMKYAKKLRDRAEG